MEEVLEWFWWKIFNCFRYYYYDEFGDELLKTDAWKSYGDELVSVYYFNFSRSMILLNNSVMDRTWSMIFYLGWDYKWMRYIPTYKEIMTNRHNGRLTAWQTNRHTNIETDRWTGGQTDIQQKDTRKQKQETIQ